MQELTGAAKRYVAGQPPGWVSFRGGVAALMNHLRQALGKPRVNEVTDLLALYFKGTRRKSGESMNEYITRKNEAYMRACQSMKRVQPHYETSGSGAGSQGWERPRRNSWDYGSQPSTWSRQWTPATDGDGPAASAEEAATQDGSTRATDDTQSQDDHAWRHSWRPYAWYGGYGYGWNWDTPWYGSGEDWNRSSASSTTSSGSLSGRTSELLPIFIQGWYLLMDAGLDHGERNLVVTALNGVFTPDRVGQELRNQFPESETKRRDNRRYHSYMGEAEDWAEEDGDLKTEGYTLEELEADGLDEGEIALIAEAEDQAQTALAAMNEARRTLKEARYRQKVVKQNRKYFRGTSSRGSSASGGRPRDDSNLDCLRCGQIGHRAANCPHKPAATAAQTDVGVPAAGHQQAPFVCLAEAQNNVIPGARDYVDLSAFAQTALSVDSQPNLMTTQEAVRQGMCVIDGGATQTIGSIAAVEAVLEQNRKLHGATRLKGLCATEPPIFSFGNSTENRCCSTAKLEVSANGQPGELQVHTLDQGQSPILLSVETLRRLGAIIDFRDDLAVFRALGDRKVLRLVRGQSSHQLLSLTQDWMSLAEPAQQAVPGLSSYLQR